MEEPEVLCELDRHLKNIADILKGQSYQELEAKENMAKWLEYIAYCILLSDAMFMSEEV